MVPSGRGPHFVLMPHKFSGFPVVNRQWGFPVSQNTLAALYLPGMLQKRKSVGSLVLAIGVVGFCWFLVLISSRCAASSGMFSKEWVGQVQECSRHVAFILVVSGAV